MSNKRIMSVTLAVCRAKSAEKPTQKTGRRTQECQINIHGHEVQRILVHKAMERRRHKEKWGK